MLSELGDMAVTNADVQALQEDILGAGPSLEEELEHEHLAHNVLQHLARSRVREHNANRSKLVRAITVS